MGLDMYAYVGRPKQREEFYEQEGLEFNPKTGDWEVPAGGIERCREIAYWRKHPNLHGWMEALWTSKGRPGIDQEEGERDFNFNGIELELTWDDIERLDRDIRSGAVAKLGTQGFFFGDPADDYYQKQDLEFVRNAKAELFLGLRVFYNSSW